MRIPVYDPQVEDDKRQSKKERILNRPVDRETPVYSIGTIARMLGVSVQTLRMYEREQLIVSYKGLNGQRLYSDSDIKRLECIRKAITEQKLGIQGIKHIHAFIPCWQIRGCSENEREHCQAYKGSKQGCWGYPHTDDFCATQKCRECEVYRIAVNCEDIKAAIIGLSQQRDLV